MPPLVEHASPSIEPDLINDHEDDAPLRYWRIDNVLGPVAVLGLVERVLIEQLSQLEK
jgi:hypothetical protein